jgi:hypothetical protein
MFTRRAFAALAAQAGNQQIRDLIYGGGTPAPPKAPAGQRPAAPKPAAAPAQAAGAFVPEWVVPGLRLTYYLMTGSLSGSLNGWDPNDEGDWENKVTKQKYSKEREGRSSHGLIQATVAGMDGQVVALGQPFFLFNGQDTTPILNSSLDDLYTTDTGGDFWMHPRKQALWRQQGQARAITWRANNQAIPATAVVIANATGKTFWAYDQQSGRLLYLSRLTRTAPAIRDPKATLPDSVSYATFLRFVGVRQLSLPWLRSPLPEWAARLNGLSYSGQMKLEFPGAVPGTGHGVTQTMRVVRRGRNWLLFQSSSQEQIGVSLPSENKVCCGPGSLPGVIISPEALAQLRPGQVLDQDPHTRFTVRVAGADPRGVMLQSEGPTQSYAFLYDRTQGLLMRSVSRDRSLSQGQNMVRVREMQLAGRT